MTRSVFLKTHHNVLQVTTLNVQVWYTKHEIDKGVIRMTEMNKDNHELECEHCGTTSELTPVMTYVFQGEEKHVCVHCLPMLIHG